jgi:hypothetical protein
MIFEVAGMTERSRRKSIEKWKMLFEVERIMGRQSQEFMNKSRLLFEMQSTVHSTTTKVEEDYQNNI